MMSFSFGCVGMVKGRMRSRPKVTRAGEGFVTGLPMKAADTLVVNAVLLVVSHMVAGEAE